MFNLKITYFTLKRMTRDYLNLLILFVAPIVSITLQFFIFSVHEGLDTVLRRNIIPVIVTFQISGGLMAIEYMRNDLYGERNKRIKSLPITLSRYIISVILAVSVFTIVSGIFLIGVTTILYDVHWGNFFVILLIMIICSIPIQLIFATIFLSAKDYRTASTLGWIFFGLNMILGGMIGPINISFLSLMFDYGNLITLISNLLIAIGYNGFTRTFFISGAILLFVTIITLVCVYLLGRRKI